MNLRKYAYFLLLRVLRGIKLGYYYDLYLREDQNGIPPHRTEELLVALLEHCQKNVPYYAGIMKEMGDFHDDPVAYLQHFPILTKEIIRNHFEDLKSADLAQRKWFPMTSGGSTGEPGTILQDYEFSAKSGAIQLLFSHLAGRETGELEVYLWGSDREITHGRENWKARFVSRLTNSVFFNAFRIPPQKMREFVTFINTRKPKLIVAYAGSLTDLAKFTEKEGLHVEPQKAIIVSAETLLPHMRETLERVFQCKVYNRYGSREIGNIACERPGCKGLWIPPWGNFVEILDDQGRRVPDGTEGRIVITSLVNFAMPLIRYQIDDYGALLPQEQKEPKTPGQVFKAINGRVINQFRNKEGANVNPGFLCGLFFFNDWVKQYQIIQKDVSHIVYRIVLAGAPLPQSEQEKFIETTRLAFGNDCKVEFDFVDDIPASGSGKFHYTICEIKK